MESALKLLLELEVVRRYQFSDSKRGKFLLDEQSHTIFLSLSKFNPATPRIQKALTQWTNNHCDL